MTAISEAAAALIAALRRVSDPVERYTAAKEIETQLVSDIKQVKATAAVELHPNRSWREVGDMLGVTGSRAEQISRAAR
jgi:hypothetical protein